MMTPTPWPQSGETTITPAAREQIEALLPRYPQKRSALIPSLWIIQQEIGWLAPEAMEELAEILDLQPVEIEETASFYSLLFKKKVGRYVVDVCTSVSCMLLGSGPLSRAVQQKYAIKPGETSSDGMFTLREVECLAGCMGAPCAQINYEYLENLTPDSILQVLDGFAANPGRTDSGASTGSHSAGETKS